MGNNDPIEEEKADTTEDTCNLHEENLDNCEDGILKSLDEAMTLANESFSQADYQKLIAHYYFGEYQTHAKLLYFQIMDFPRRYG